MNKIFNIFCLISAVFSYAQVTIAVETAKRDYTANDEIVVSIVLEIVGQNMVQETPLRLFDTSKFDVIGSGSDQSTYVDQKTGFRVNQTIYQTVLRPKKSGKIKIGSASVVVNDKLYYTEPFDIYVAPVEKKIVAANTLDDVFLNVELEDKEVYKNQPTVAILRAYSKNFDNFRKVKNIQFPQQENVNISQVSLKKSEIEPAGNMASQVLAVFLIFPKESGNIEVSPVSAHLSSIDNTIVSNKVRINVKNLPKDAPEDYKNAVGKFDLSIINPNEEKIEIDKPFRVALKISGEGNLEALDLPQLQKSPDYTFFPPKIVKNIYSIEGNQKGEIIANYVVVPKKSGRVPINAQRFSYFDPESKQYVDLGAKTISINVLTHAEILSDRTPLERVNEYTNSVLETVDNPVIQTTNLKIKQKKAVNWNAYLINAGVLVLAFFGFLLFKNFQKRSEKNEKNAEKKTEPSLGTIAETEEELKVKLKADVNDHLSYLKILLQQHNYEAFFNTFEEMDQEVRTQYFQNSEADFSTFLERYKGQKTAELYRNLKQQIQIEKYAPVNDTEHLEELLDRIVDLYTQIDK